MELGNDRELKKYVGMAECQVLGVNLNRREYQEKTGVDLGYEPNFVRTSKSGCRAVNVIVTLKELTTGALFPLTFFMEERPALTANNNPKYVNARCQSAVQLASWFSKFDHRPAFHGEPELLTFIRVLTSPVLRWYGDYPDSGNYPLEETQQIFEGNYGPLNSIVSRYNKWTIGVLSGIRITDRGPVQDVCNRSFVKGSTVSSMMTMTKGVDPETLKDDLKEFIKAVERTYSYANFYGNSYRFRLYNPEENVILTTDKAVISPDDELPF